MPEAVLHMDNIKGPVVTLAIRYDPHTTQIPAPRDHTQVPHVKFDVVGDFPARNVDSNGVVDLDGGVRVADGASIMGDAVRDPLLAQSHSLNLPQLVLEQKREQQYMKQWVLPTEHALVKQSLGCSGQKLAKTCKTTNFHKMWKHTLYMMVMAYFRFFGHDSVDSKPSLHVVQ